MRVGAVDMGTNSTRLLVADLRDADLDEVERLLGVDATGQPFNSVMAVELRAAELLTLEAAWKLGERTATDMDMAIAKLKASEMLAMVADEALQIHGGMGLMSELPLERIWRDARIERIWEDRKSVV